jgi:hypothetical protein
MTCAACMKPALLCGTCIEAGNLALKQGFAREQHRVHKALKIIESHMPCAHGAMDNPNCPYCQIRLALMHESETETSPLLEVIKCLIEANELRKTNREDTIGVLMRCGAFRHVDVALLSRQIDQK